MVAPVDLSRVADALGLGAHEHVAVVGGGGKTTLLFALGEQLAGRVVLTTTTKMGAGRRHHFPVVLGLPADPSEGHRVVLAWRAVEGSKALGVPPEMCDAWFPRVDHLVVEADGSRGRPFKAPTAYEPVIPATVTTVVAVIGADALDRVIEDQCHRPLRVAAVAGCSPYDRLTPERAAAVIASPRGGRQYVPDGVRFLALVTRVDPTTGPLVAALDEALGDRGVPLVAVSSTAEPIARR